MKKQLILIMTDTTRKDMIGCYGNPDMSTPNIDGLADEGVRFDNCYSCQPVCGPARSAIFTGKFPHTNGMVANNLSLRDGTKTIGEFLQNNGVHTAYIGKWHLDGGDYFGRGECPKGYDKEYWYDMKDYLEELTPDERVFSRQRENAYSEDLTEDFLYAHRCTDRALDYIEHNYLNDFCMTVSYDEPHGPSLCTAPYNRMYEGYVFPDSDEYHDNLNEKPLFQKLWAEESNGKTPEQLRTVDKSASLLLGCNSYVDSEIGRVIRLVREKCPDAIIMYTSDHGDMLGAHRLYSKNATAYKEVANVPFIITGIGKKGVVEKPISHIDIAPTILDYFGVEIPKTFEGKSILKKWDTEGAFENSEAFVEFTRYEVDHDGFGGLQMMRAIVSERYKLVINLLDKDEFYDIYNDPAENNNLIDDESLETVRNELHDKLLAHMNDTRDLYRGYQWACRPWRKDKKPNWENDGCTRQREEEPGEERQLDYDTGLTMETAVRHKQL